MLLVACGGSEADMTIPDSGVDTLAAAGDTLPATGGAPVASGGAGGSLTVGGSPGTGGSLGGAGGTIGGAPGTGGAVAAGGSGGAVTTGGAGGGAAVQDPQMCPQNHGGNICFRGPNVPGSRRYMTKVINARKYICVQNCTLPAAITSCQSTIGPVDPGYNPYRLCVPSCDQACAEDQACKDGACPQ